MSIEKKPLVVGFDGLHRSGKGTQAELLSRTLAEKGVKTLIVRGDGTREGLGGSDGDPYDQAWQQRCTRLKTIDRTVESWNYSSYLLAEELHRWIGMTASNDVIIVDRTLISRATFLLHRGVATQGKQLTFEGLYPDAKSRQVEASFGLEDITPDYIFDFQVSSPEDLLSRLDREDPKYDFRAQNIRGGFAVAGIASQHLPSQTQDRIETIDATEPCLNIHRHVLRSLGEVSYRVL